jgi:hypothetical protein
MSVLYSQHAYITFAQEYFHQVARKQKAHYQAKPLPATIFFRYAKARSEGKYSVSRINIVSTAGLRT